MMRKYAQLIIALPLPLLVLFALHSYSLPLSLSTNNRWIVHDEPTGQRTKLSCANWPTHIGLMLAEGLNKQPIDNIVSQLVKLKINCVRLTWATHMFTRYANQTIEQALDSLGLAGIKSVININNPDVLNMTHPQAYAYVVDVLGAYNIMVVSDNHISEPKWCCAPNDGNAFFGDTSFDPNEWVQGLTLAAQFLKGKIPVVGISLRNELRGPLQNLDGWYGNVTKGALAVHQANPDVLVIISGLHNDTDISFLNAKPLNLTLNNKVVYEVHAYPFSGQNKDWSQEPTNFLCGELMHELDHNAGFLTTGPHPSPLFVSEIGIDLITRSDPDDRWLTCILSYLAGGDIDWAWGALQGSYYFREGKVDTEEPYGLLNFQWDQLSYEQFPQRFHLVLKKLQDPVLQQLLKQPNSNLLYHPQSGQCIKANEQNQIEASDCSDATGWSQEGEKIKLNGNCLKAVGEERIAFLSTDCVSEQTSWKPISYSGLHFAVVNEEGKSLCLQKDDNSSMILTNGCICVEDNPECMDNPQNQWFKLVPTNEY